MKETVNHPKHYNMGRFEVIDVIEDWGLGFNDGNAVKYIARAKHKGTEVEDLKKAVWYLNRCIGQLEERRDNGPQGVSAGINRVGVRANSRRVVGTTKGTSKRRGV